MNTIRIIEHGVGEFAVEGDLTFNRIDAKTVASFAFLTAADSITIDLGKVGNTDSGGLALLIEWIKYARQRRIELKFKNLPRQLLTLAKLSGLDTSDYFSGTTDSTSHQ